MGEHMGTAPIHTSATPPGSYLRIHSTARRVNNAKPLNHLAAAGVIKALNPAGDRPDGIHIAFTSDRSGSLKVHLVDVDGTGLALVMEFVGFVFRPRWRPWVFELR